jgi:hypothetical protein
LPNLIFSNIIPFRMINQPTTIPVTIRATNTEYCVAVEVHCGSRYPRQSK